MTVCPATGHSRRQLSILDRHLPPLATPALAQPKLTKSLKGITSKRANTILAMTGTCFGQEESYGHLVRNERELEKIQSYIEETPVRAGLARKAMSIGGRAQDG